MDLKDTLQIIAEFAVLERSEAAALFNNTRFKWLRIRAKSWLDHVFYCSSSYWQFKLNDEVNSHGNLTTLEVYALIFDLGNPYTHRDKTRDRQGSCEPSGIDSLSDDNTKPISRDA